MARALWFISKWFFKVSIVISAVSWGIVAVTLSIWANDNAPPFRFYETSVVNAAPGDTMFLSARVERDTARKCRVEVTRTLIDSVGTVHTIGFAKISPQSIKMREAANPGELVTNSVVPATASYGTGIFNADLNYFCNPWHEYVKPINVRVTYQVRVLQP